MFKWRTPLAFIIDSSGHLQCSRSNLANFRLENVFGVFFTQCAFVRPDIKFTMASCSNNRSLSLRKSKSVVDDQSDEEDVIQESDDSEVDYCDQSDHETNSEASGLDDDDEISNVKVETEVNVADQIYDSKGELTLVNIVTYRGRDGRTKWQNCPPISRTGSRRIFSEVAGPKGDALNAKTPMEAWSCFIDDSIFDLVVSETNKYINKQQKKFSRSRDARLTNKIEMKAFLGLLYYAGVLKSAKLFTEDLWALDGTGIDLFIAAMSRKRFFFLLRCLRFDDTSDRSIRRKVDKLAPIRTLSEMFRANLLSNYEMGEFVTVDERLEPFRGKCSFKQYMKTKSAKYGIKIFMLSDAQTFYTSNFEVYVGQQPEGPYKASNDADSVVKRLIQPVDQSGRNVTMDNWFVTTALVEDLLENHNLTCVGTIHKNRQEIPSQFLISKRRKVYSTLAAFTKDMILLSYKSHKNKLMLLVSSMHRDAPVETTEDKEPEIVCFYNATKGGVDTVDKLCDMYSVSRKSSRWPLTVFFSFLNVAALNAYVVYQANNDSKKVLLQRRFLKEIALELTKEQLQYRATLSNLSVSLKKRISFYASQEEVEELSAKRLKIGRRRCEDCGPKKDRKTTTACEMCSKLICKQHSVNYCNECSLKWHQSLNEQFVKTEESE